METVAEALFSGRFDARPAELQRIRDGLRAALEGAGVTGSRRDAVVMAVNEACMNVIQHGYAGRPGWIGVALTLEGDRLEAHIEDGAPALDPARVQPRDLAAVRPGGLGVHFMRSLMDSVEYRPDPGGTGNRLIMQVRLYKQEESHELRSDP